MPILFLVTKLLTNCYVRHGVSRSVSVVAAWLLHTGGVPTVPAALGMLARLRPQSRPNDGFINQLELYQRLNYRIVKHDPRYLNFALQHNDPHRLLFQSSESTTTISPQTSRKIRCSKCRKILTYQYHVVDHTPGEFPHWTQGVLTSSSCRQGVFVTDLSLLTEDIKYQSELWQRVNKLDCKFCAHKIGNWGLPSCGCGGRGGRGIWLNSSKVDV